MPASNLAKKAREFVQALPRDLVTRAAAFLLLKDSRSSFEIEGESPPHQRVYGWGQAIAEAGKNPLDLEELLIDSPTVRTLRQAGVKLIVLLVIQGEITALAENPLMDAYIQATNGITRAVILDFTELDYMNSSGIGLLVTLLIRANRQNQKLMAIGLNEHYQQIFELTRLDEAISIYDDEAAALATLH